tara:strand:+ start:55840 stop:56058 length:219 start_codon:yes stop_codon:yes gene_type:complete
VVSVSKGLSDHRKKVAEGIVQRLEANYEWHKRQTRVIFKANAVMMLTQGSSIEETYDMLESLIIVMMGEYGE